MSGMVLGNEINDAFWDIAMMPNLLPTFLQNDEILAEDLEQCHLRSYRIVDPPLEFRLCPLIPSSGIWSPVGADLWYASAILSLIPFHFSRFDTVLEIGSGAVGLAGLSLAARLGDESKTIILSDIGDFEILTHLQKNIDRNAHVSSCAKIMVQKIDWSDHSVINDLPKIDLIVGSELIYTPETALACSSFISKLFIHKPNCVALIVQVIDRPGWPDVLTSFSDNFVEIINPLPSKVHKQVRHMLGKTMHGTSDMTKYGLCFIGSKDSCISTVINKSFFQ
jgi:Lysine methyltransferase